MSRWGIGSLAEFDRQFSQTQSLFNWCQDFEAELGNAALKDTRFHRVRLDFCEKVIPLLGFGDLLLVQNMRRAIAEAHVGIGNAETADALYCEWLAADPNWGWGWIGWSDLFWLGHDRPRDYRRTEELLGSALRQEGLRDRDDVLERLSELYGETADITKKQQIDRMLRRHVAPPSGGDSSGPAGRSESARPVVGSGVQEDLPRKRKIGRNEPCPCGSGRKYKHCCGR